MSKDSLGIADTLLKAQQAWLGHPEEWLAAQLELSTNMNNLNFHALAYLMGEMPPPLAEAAEGDERFSDEVWKSNPAYCLMMQNYLTYTRSLARIVYDTPGIPKADAHGAAFWTRQWFNALAPTNFLLTNPEALHKAWQSGGKTLQQGAENLMCDIKARDLQMVDSTPFKLGENVANTPGSVVFRNEVMELIQYQPTTKKVHAMPIVFVPPWINKYYILDLNDKKSMVRWLLNQGYSVFMISWKNPGAEMAECSFEDHMFKGALAAIEVARSICEVPQVHAVGYCIGGAGLSALMAWLNHKYPNKTKCPVAHWTLLAALTDFSKPGEVSTFINDKTLATIDALMDKQGYLDAKQIGWSFRFLRPNSLIWHYVVHRYLYGEKTPAFDVLAWNVDSIRIPRATHRFCLHEFYVHNKLTKKDALTIAGHPIDLGRIQQALYIVGAADDHITPWRGTFKTAALVGGPVRYVLSTSGHILGIINPPDPKSKREFWAGDASGVTTARKWKSEQTQQSGSWWDDWNEWLSTRSGPMRAPPTDGNKAYPVLCEAPGTYVREA
ncbi:class I poly(R)-hydroxyalkanoic acid synthase [soil metagenome]